MSIGGNDGVPALKASIYPAGIARMPNGDILVDNIAGISRIDSAGIIHVVNNIHNYGFSGDGGPAIDAITNEPWDVATDAAGNIFIADANNNRIRRIDAQTGIIDTVAGSGPVNGFENYDKGSYCGDGGPATQACINTPWGIAVAPDGTLYIAENDERVRKVTPDGIIMTFFSRAGKRLRLSSTGNLFMGSYRIQPNGHAFDVIFATPTQSAIGDGIVARSQQSGYRGAIPSSGVAVDSEGNLFVADSWNKRVRAVRYGAVMAEPGSSVSASGGSAQMAATGAAFPTALQITLKSPEGTLENGIRVDFAAPTSGASCTFAGGSSTYSVLTDIDGHASATCTANAQTGAYSVTATPLALGQSASFALTNSNSVTTPPACTLSASPVVISAGASSTLTASCTPDATSYVWTHSGFGSGVSSGAVSPITPTVYTVVASNAAGSSNSASAAVYVCNTAPSQLYAGQTLIGTGAREPFNSGIGNDTIDGAAGVDTVIYNCNRSSFTLTKTASGWMVSSSAEGIDTLTNVERIQFPNETLALDISGNAGQAYRIYQAAFNRTPDNAGLKYWIGVMDNGESLNNVAAGFINSAEFQSLYGANPSNPEFVTKLYSNILHRAPDQAGYDYWLDVLNRHLISNIDTLVNFSESPENQAGVIGDILNGIDLLN